MLIYFLLFLCLGLIFGVGRRGGKMLKPKLRDLVIAILTAIITFVTASCTASISASDLKAEAGVVVESTQ